MAEVGVFYTRKTKGYNHLWFMPVGIDKNEYSVFLLHYNTKIRKVQVSSENPRWVKTQFEGGRLEQPDINSIPPEDQKSMINKLFRKFR